MSIRTWEKEAKMDELGKFSHLEHTQENFSKAIRHSIHKWKCLRKETLKQHGLVIKGIAGYLCNETDPGEHIIGASDCALCQMVFTTYPRCSKCPFVQVTGHNCSEDYHGANSPWHEWTSNHDPEPMIAALEALLIKVQGKPSGFRNFMKRMLHFEFPKLS
jgi:hypothetical protein